MAALHPLWSFFAGDDFPIHGVCTDVFGCVIDLTGAAAEWKLCARNGTAALDMSIGSGITVTDASIGRLLVDVTAVLSAPLAPGRYRDQLRIITADGEVSTQWTGFIDVKQPL